jgi:hypothetical protein
MYEADELSDEVLQRLANASDQADPGPWVAVVDGRDQIGGDSFILVGDRDDRRTDLYVTRDHVPASAADLDVIALGRTYLPMLVDEVRRLRGLLEQRS